MRSLEASLKCRLFMGCLGVTHVFLLIFGSSSEFAPLWNTPNQRLIESIPSENDGLSGILVRLDVAVGSIRTLPRT